MMIERVIFCALSSVVMLSQVPHETLLKRDDGVVVALQDKTMLALLSQQATISLLFFSRDAYEQAIRGLPDSEIDLVLRKRRHYWAPNATGHGLNYLYQIEQRCLTLTALASAEKVRAAPARLDEHFEQSLQLLVSISGENRYQDMSMASLLVLVVEGEAKVRNEALDAQEAARRSGDSRGAERFMETVKRSESFGQALGSVLESLGRPQYTQALPQVSLSRGVFVWPRDAALTNLLTAQHETHAIWKDGLVANWSLDDLPELEKRGKSVRILYFNSGQLLMDLNSLTPAEQEREFARRFEAGRGASLEARREYLYSVWLEQHLLRRKALAQAKRQNEVLSAILTRQITEEAQALRQELALYPVWLDEKDKQEKDPAEALKKREEQLQQEASFLAALCHLEGDATSETLFTKVSVFQPAQP